MLLIPEIDTVLITPPRTGSTSLRDAVLRCYPKAAAIYRHMEADGVPHGYDFTRRICVIRNPYIRLWSLYNFLGQTNSGTPDWNRRMRASVDKPFEEWLLHNREVFTNPYGPDNQTYHPYYAVKHYIPENMKSQAIYARQDLGVEVRKMDDIAALFDELGLSMLKVNGSVRDDLPELSCEAEIHMRTFHGWDLAQYGL